MLKTLSLLAAAALVSTSATAQDAVLPGLVFDPATGEATFTLGGAETFQITGFEVDSQAGLLNPESGTLALIPGATPIAAPVATNINFAIFPIGSAVEIAAGASFGQLVAPENLEEAISGLVLRFTDEAFNTYDSTFASDNPLTATIAVVPEPASAVAVLGLAGLATLRRRSA